MKEVSKKRVQLNSRPIRPVRNPMPECGTCTGTSILKQRGPEKLQMNFDHLSVVSEECLTNSDDQAEREKRNQLVSDDFVPETAVGLLADFQAVMPPLSHFENLSYRDIGPNVGMSIKHLLSILSFLFFL